MLHSQIMPARFLITIVGARNLPVMDRSSNSTDAYVEVCYSFIKKIKLYKLYL